MTGHTKRKIFILLGLVTLSMMVIATGLSRLDLQPGIPIPKLEGDQIAAAQTGGNQFVSIPATRFVIILILLILGGIMLYATFQLLKGADRKMLMETIRVILIISAVSSGFIFLVMLIPSSESSIPAEIIQPTPEPPVTAPLGAVPPILLWVVGFILLAMTVLVAIWVMSSRTPRPMAMVGLEAEKAWQALKTGMDLKDVIIRCYQQMSLALEQEQGIERKDFMTTGEFEKMLTSSGIPSDPIHQLTRLFNAARYGNWQPSQVDEQKALQCLEEIVLYSRKVSEEAK
jgi:hypothetical protein